MVMTNFLADEITGLLSHKKLAAFGLFGCKKKRTHSGRVWQRPLCRGQIKIKPQTINR